jgi:RNA polymerase subunit RPABC4/transcription elongation factor Spt4
MNNKNPFKGPEYEQWCRCRFCKAVFMEEETIITEDEEYCPECGAEGTIEDVLNDFV